MTEESLVVSPGRMALALGVAPARTSRHTYWAERLTYGSHSGAAHIFGWTAFAIMLVVAVGFCFFGVIPQDEGELLVYPSLIARGLRPYANIWMMYPPSTYLLLAGLMKVGVPGLVAERGLGLLARVVYVLLVNRALTGSWRRFSWIGSTITFGLVLMQPMGELQMRAYPWLVGLPVFFLGLLAMKRQPFLAATLLVLAGTFRFEFGVAGLTALSLFALLSLRDATCRWRLVLAAIAASVGLVIFFLLLDALSGGSAIRDVFLDPIQRIGPARRLPLLPLDVPVIALPIIAAMLAGPVVLALLGLRRGLRYVAATNLALVPLSIHFVQRPDAQYLYWSAAVIVPWLLVSLRDMSETLTPAPSADREPSAGLIWAWRSLGWLWAFTAPLGWALLLAYTILLSPMSALSPISLWSGPSRLVSGNGGTIFAATALQARSDRQMVAYLRQHAQPGATIFIAPSRIRNAMYNATHLYYVLGLKPASRHLEMNPGVETRWDVQREIVRDLRNCIWIVLWKHGYWHERNGTQRPGAPLLASYIHSRYHPVLKNREYILLHRFT